MDFCGFSFALPPAHFGQQAEYSLPSIIVVAVDSLHSSGELSGLQNSHLPDSIFFVGVFIFSPRGLFPAFCSSLLLQHVTHLQQGLSSAS